MIYRIRNLQLIVQPNGVCVMSLCVSVSKEQYVTWAERYEQASADLNEQYKVALHSHSVKSRIQSFTTHSFTKSRVVPHAVCRATAKARGRERDRLAGAGDGNPAIATGVAPWCRMMRKLASGRVRDVSYTLVPLSVSRLSVN